MPYCHNCGKPTNVGAKFCGECGTDLRSLASTPTPAPKAEAKASNSFIPFNPKRTGDDDDDDNYLDRIEHLDIRMNGLQVEIQKDRPMGESIAGVMSQGNPTTPPEKIERDAPYKDVDSKAFLKEFEKEAGTMRPDGKNNS